MPLPTIRETTMRFPASAANTLHKGTGVFPEFSAVTAADVQAGGAASTVISRTVVGAPSSTVTITNIPSTFSSLRIDVHGRSGIAGVWGSGVIQLGTGGVIDSGANYDYLLVEGFGTNITSGEVLGITYIFFGRIVGSTSPVPASTPTVSSIYLPNYKGTTFWKNVIMETSTKIDTASGGFFNVRSTGVWRNTGAINCFTLFTDAPGWSVGTIIELTGIP